MGVVAVMAIIATGYSFWVSSQPRIHILVMFSESERRYNFTNYPQTILDHLEDNKVYADVTFRYLDCDHWNPEDEIVQAGKIVEEEDAKRKIDIIVTIGDQATYSTLCNDIPQVNTLPFVFAGVQYPNEKQMESHKNVTGVTDTPDVEQNIYIAKELTGVGHTFTIMDESFLDRKTRANINEQLANNKKVVNNLDWRESIHDLVTKYKGKYSITSLSLRNIAVNTKVTEPMNEKTGQNLVLLLRKYSPLTYIQLKYDAASMQMIRFGNTYPIGLSSCF